MKAAPLVEIAHDPCDRIMRWLGRDQKKPSFFGL